MYDKRGPETFVGRLEEVYAVEPSSGNGKGTEYETSGQYGSEWTRGHEKKANNSVSIKMMIYHVLTYRIWWLSRWVQKPWCRLV